MKFKIGDEVKFVHGDDHKEFCPHFFAQDVGIPLKCIVHGNTSLGPHYIKHGATITDIWGTYYVVRWINRSHKEMRLGFKEESLSKLKITNWKERIEDGNRM